MSYLIRPDYFATIQDINLTQITTGYPGIIAVSEARAIAEAKSFLIQKYDLENEFTDTSVWAWTEPYSAGDRVYLNASIYDSAQTYDAKALILRASDNAILRCNADGTTGVYDASKWDIVGYQYDLFYAAYPWPIYDTNKFYKIGDKVYWAGHVYTAKRNTLIPSHQQQLQREDQTSNPQYNVRPDLDVDAYSWTDEGAYTLPADNDITNASQWTPGDNRDQQMVQKVVAIALFHIHKRISPQNVPVHISHSYKGDPADTIVNGSDVVYPIYSALGWLQAIARGKVSAALPKYQPNKQVAITWGGSPKKINDY